MSDEAARSQDSETVAAVVVAAGKGLRVGGDLRTGAASKNGDEVVVGTALMLIGENSRSVAKSVGDKLVDGKP